MCRFLPFRLSLLLPLAVVACVTPTGAKDTAGDTAATDSAGGDTDTDADTDTDTDTDTTGCAAPTLATRIAVVTDIDETLTTDDNEFLQEVIEAGYDPAMRPDANTLMQAYAALGYRIIYVTARGEDLPMAGDVTTTEATDDWLAAHDFPLVDPGDVFLADGIGALGSSAADYKTGVLQELQGEGFVFQYAYGNADTDVEAYQNVGLDDARDYLVGDLSVDAGTYGVVGISNDDAYTNHIVTQMPTVPCAE